MNIFHAWSEELLLILPIMQESNYRETISQFYPKNLLIKNLTYIQMTIINDRWHQTKKKKKNMLSNENV